MIQHIIQGLFAGLFIGIGAVLLPGLIYGKNRYNQKKTTSHRLACLGTFVVWLMMLFLYPLGKYANPFVTILIFISGPLLWTIWGITVRKQPAQGYTPEQYFQYLEEVIGTSLITTEQKQLIEHYRSHAADLADLKNEFVALDIKLFNTPARHTEQKEALQKSINDISDKMAQKQQILNEIAASKECKDLFLRIEFLKNPKNRTLITKESYDRNAKPKKWEQSVEAKLLAAYESGILTHAEYLETLQRQKESYGKNPKHKKREQDAEAKLLEAYENGILNRTEYLEALQRIQAEQ